MNKRLIKLLLFFPLVWAVFYLIAVFFNEGCSYDCPNSFLISFFVTLVVFATFIAIRFNKYFGQGDENKKEQSAIVPKQGDKKYGSVFLKLFLLGILLDFFAGATEAVDNLFLDLVVLVAAIIYVYIFSKTVNEAMLSVGKKNWWPLGLLVLIPLGFFIVYFIVRAKLKPHNKWGKDNILLIIALIIIPLLILGILASIVLVSVNIAREKARDAKRVSDIQSLVLALDQYVDENGSYPAMLSSLAPQYISEIPSDPTTNRPYYYATCQPDKKQVEYRGLVINVGPSRVHLGAKLEDKASSFLEKDDDYNSFTATAWTACDGAWSGGFSGDDPMYDIFR